MTSPSLFVMLSEVEASGPDMKLTLGHIQEKQQIDEVFYR